MELLLADLRQRISGGEAVHVEEYLHAHPWLMDDEATAVDLIYSEFFFKAGTPHEIEPRQFIERFPQFERQLSLQFEVYEAIESPRRSAAETDSMSRHRDSTDPSPTATDPAPRQIGDYVVEREIGRGGMGIVYAARQQSLDRRVALKVLPFAATLDDRQLERFKNESQAAALLQHPHIVPVHAVGCEDGIHFFAMQLIDGQPLSAFAGDRSDRDTVRRAARIGWQAADALQHAHEAGIIHRDIKPANLLLDQPDHVWITDFGLARLPNDRDLTLPGDVVGTLRYMSPEQSSGKPWLVDHRTDVYSLGLTLYELLTGRPAHDLTDHHQLLRSITDAEPPRPRQINPAIPADLETVLMKAIQKDRNDRYSDAREFADDLQRFLDHRPIAAKRSTWISRTGKWCRRHQVVATLCAVFLVLLTCGFALSTALIAREHNNTRAALGDKERAWTKAADHLQYAHSLVNRLARQTADELKFVPGAQRVREQTLRTVIQHYEKFIAHVDSDPSFRAEIAEARVQLAELGAATSAAGIDPLEQARRACQSWDALVEIDPDRVRYLAGRSAGYRALGITLRRGGELDASRTSYETSLKDGRRLLELAPESLGVHQNELSATLANLGNLCRQQGRFPDADAYLSEALAVQTVALAANPLDVDFQHGLALIHSNLGILKRATGDPEQARQHYQTAIESWNRLLMSFPSDIGFSSDLTRTLTNLGNLHGSRSEWTHALACYRDAIRRSEQLVDLNPHVDRFAHQLASGWLNSGHALADSAVQNRGQAFPPAAVDAWRRSFQIREQLDRCLFIHNDRAELALAYSLVAEAEARSGHREESIRLLKLATADGELLLRGDPRDENIRGQLRRDKQLLDKLTSQHGSD